MVELLARAATKVKYYIDQFKHFLYDFGYDSAEEFEDDDIPDKRYDIAAEFYSLSVSDMKTIIEINDVLPEECTRIINSGYHLWQIIEIYQKENGLEKLETVFSELVASMIPHEDDEEGSVLSNKVTYDQVETVVDLVTEAGGNRSHVVNLLEIHNFER